MSENPFWTFSLHFYQQPGVEQECIAFQDQFGGNVNLLLFCVWLGLEEIDASEKLISEVERLVSAWDQEVVRPLRTIRRSLAKGGKGQAYVKTKELELTSERVLQDALYQWYVSSALIGTGRQTARENVLAYAGKFCEPGNCLGNLLSQLPHLCKSR